VKVFESEAPSREIPLSVFDVDVNITSLEITETNGTSIRVLNYTSTANLINPALNFSRINWTTGTFSGEINRIYTYDLKTTDSAGSAVVNASIKLVDVRGESLYDGKSDSNGEIPQQPITRSVFDYTYQTGNEQGPHTLYVKKYGKNFLEIAKEFSAATVDTTQLSDNQYVILDEVNASNQSEITYIAPTKVTYSDREVETVGADMVITLNNIPVAPSIDCSNNGEEIAPFAASSAL